MVHDSSRHGFPSRMTVGKMLECIGSKAPISHDPTCGWVLDGMGQYGSKIPPNGWFSTVCPLASAGSCHGRGLCQRFCFWRNTGRRDLQEIGKAMICKRMQNPMAMILTCYPSFSAAFAQLPLIWHNLSLVNWLPVGPDVANQVHNDVNSSDFGELGQVRIIRAEGMMGWWVWKPYNTFNTLVFMLVSPPAASGRTLISHGFAPTGKDFLTSGITGEPIEAYIFCPFVSHSLQVTVQFASKSVLRSSIIINRIQKAQTQVGPSTTKSWNTW